MFFFDAVLHVTSELMLDTLVIGCILYEYTITCLDWWTDIPPPPLTFSLSNETHHLIYSKSVQEKTAWFNG